MPTDDTNLADRPGGLIETQSGNQPRVVFFHFVAGLLMCVLLVGLGIQQLFRNDVYDERERIQNQRRIITPGPRGDIVDREGRVLAGSKSLVSVMVLLDEFRAEFRREANIIHRNYERGGSKGLLSWGQINSIARLTVLQRYLDQVGSIIGRPLKVDQAGLERHFSASRLLPYVLVGNLEGPDYARLIEQLPVDSPLQIYPTSARVYPYGSAAAHTIGSVKVEQNIESPDLPQPDLTTFKIAGIAGRDGLEARFDSQLRGKAGGRIVRVDPSGYRIDPPLQELRVEQGRTLETSLDIDLQLAAETKLAETEMSGAAVAIDIQTGEVLALASVPAYDLNELSPRYSTAKHLEIVEKGGYLPRAIQGTYSPGSAFKILVTIAAMRSGAIDRETRYVCEGTLVIGGRPFDCHDRTAHGELTLAQAIEKSCNIYFYKVGLATGGDAIAAEARRFGFGQRSGFELNQYEARNDLLIVPDQAWKRRNNLGPWNPGDTANLSIGQGELSLTPLQMAAFTASFARGETRTTPTLLHDPVRAPVHTEPIGLPAASYEAIVRGMEQVTLTGTARSLHASYLPKLTGLRVAGKTGTAQKRTPKGTVNFAWFICFAPVENPRIAIAVMIEGDTPGEETGGGRYAVPVANGILKAWWDKEQVRNSPISLRPN